MSTTLVKPAEVERKWYVLDAAGKPLGRVAAQAAVLLRGKQKVDFTPNVDCGDHVIIINAEKAILTGKKLDQKLYRRHSGYISGMMETKPELVVYEAVRGMLPHNSMGRTMIKKLRVYKGAQHDHAAQKPVAIELVK
mgnify:CR=1 FL=1